MRKRTDIDWSKHIVEAETAGDFATIHRLRIPDSICLMVEFINMHDRGLLVCGDFGSWIFSRCFYPSREGNVSDDYWLEKLYIANDRQDPFDFSKKSLDSETNKMVSDYENENGYDNEEISEFAEILNGCDCRCDVEYVTNYNSDCVEPEDIPSGLIICERLDIIFDAFDEICARIKGTENETKNWR